MERTETFENSNITNFPNADVSKNIENIPTPKSDKIFEKAKKLYQVSKYKSEFNWNTYRELELRFGHDQPRGGITFNTPFKLINQHATCQQCLYAFEVDTYGRGCIHDCVYCYAKAQLTVYGYWNKPFPMPVDLTDIWKVFYTVFETDKPNKWREIMEKRIPIRLGSGSDCFMHMDKKYKVPQEFLRMLKFYNYPYIIVTRSDLVAHDDYINLLDPDLASIQLSIPSSNDELNKKIEPGAPSAARRLKALKKLVQAGFWTTVRINPLFPIFPDGYYSNPHFDRTNVPRFDYFSYDLINQIAETGCQSLLAGMVRLSKFGMNQIEKATGFDLTPFFHTEHRKGNLGVKHIRDYHYSEPEVRAYYERVHAKCIQQGVEFTTCYIGNGENMFWSDQDLWSNKTDCCNAKNRVKGFGEDARQVPFESRTKITNSKCSVANYPDELHKPFTYEKTNPFMITGNKVEINPEILNEI